MNNAASLLLPNQSACDYHYTIPMVGMSESMNLSISAAISLYDTTKRLRTHLDAGEGLYTFHKKDDMTAILSVKILSAPILKIRSASASSFTVKTST